MPNVSTEQLKKAYTNFRVKLNTDEEVKRWISLACSYKALLTLTQHCSPGYWLPDIGEVSDRNTGHLRVSLSPAKLYSAF